MSYTQVQIDNISNSPCVVYYNNKNLGVIAPDDIELNQSLTSNPIGSHLTGGAPVAYINNLGELEISFTVFNFDKNRDSVLLSDYTAEGTQATSTSDPVTGTLEYRADPIVASKAPLVIYPLASEGGAKKAADGTNELTIYVPLAVVTDARGLSIKTEEASAITYTFKAVADPTNNNRMWLQTAGVVVVENTSTTYTPPV